MIENLTIENFLEKLKNKEFSAKEFFEKLFEKIEKEDKETGAFLSLNRKGALKEAQKIDNLISKKEKLPPLAGVPCAIKDNVLVEGLKCTAGSKILENYVAPFDATVIKKLKEAGAIVVGKTNLDEFAMGSSTEYSAFKITKNPHDHEKVPGGSSGGSSAAVAKNFSLFSLGSDTGGSIRQPAAFCKVVGLKPTYGAVSRFGLIAFASSLDQIGPLTKNVRDCELVFEIIKGKDILDSTSVEIEKKFEEKKEIKVGIPKEYLVEGIEPKVKEAFDKAVKKFQEKGIKFEEISLPHTEYALPCYYIVACAEASSNLARYDGLRYGNFCEGVDVFDTYSKTRRLFGKEVKRRIILGTFVLSAGYYEAFYLKAQKVRRKIKEDFKKAFEKVDLIFTPVSPTLPFKIGEKITDPLKMYLSDLFTVSVNLAGLPAISIPIENLPVGLQIIGDSFSEAKIFRVAKLYDRD
jgi:aspartyl-tRNA(Asn)/glutamyl-tRNA(Gln) amidotransferase subunit A